MEIKNYADLRVKEARLKMTKGVSRAIANTLSTILLICLLGIVLGLLAVVLLQWLNGILGEPWGSLIVFGVFLVALLVFFGFRKRLFRGIFVGTLSGDDSIHTLADLDREIERVDDKVDAYHDKTLSFVDGVKDACGIADKGLRIGSALVSFFKKVL